MIMNVILWQYISENLTTPLTSLSCRVNLPLTTGTGSMNKLFANVISCDLIKLNNNVFIKNLLINKQTN